MKPFVYRNPCIERNSSDAPKNTLDNISLGIWPTTHTNTVAVSFCPIIETDADEGCQLV